MIKPIIALLIISLMMPLVSAQEAPQTRSGGTTAPEPVAQEITIIKQLALGKVLSDTQYFGAAVDHSDLSSLFNGTITWGTNTYAASELLALGDSYDPTIATSLTSWEDDFKTNIYLTTRKREITYKYKFNSPISLIGASATNPLTINFLGKSLKIVGIVDTDTLYTEDANGILKIYNDGDAFIGENETNPRWTWTLNNLNAEGTNQVIGVTNYFRKTAYTDGPAGVGQCYALPNDYLTVCLDNLTIADADLKDYMIEFPHYKPDLTNAIGKAGYENAPSLHIYTPVADGLYLNPYSSLANVNIPVKTQEAWLSLIKEQDLPGLDINSDKKILAVFYNDTSTGQIEYFGSIDPANEGATILRANYKNTKDDNILLKFNTGSSATTTLNLTWDINADSTSNLDPGADDISTAWGISNGNFNKLGITAATEEAGEITYGAAGTRIGAKDEDHRTRYGIIIKNPKSNSASEKVMLQIPPNQVYANVSIKGKVIAPVELSPSLLAILTDMESLVNKIRTTTEYKKQPAIIERALKIIEKQIQTLKKISSTINAQPRKSNRKR